MANEILTQEIARPERVGIMLNQSVAAVNPASITYGDVAIYNEIFNIAGLESTLTFDALITILYIDTFGVPQIATKSLTGETSTNIV
ncbi:MAG: hypothetical protein MI717_08825, partial [Spirochaetales bacterium]|nr:hypothetical protein [Spirochaetales bacterium]